MDNLQKTARNAAGDGANLGEPPLEAIGAILNEVMAMAVANGADSRSMPDDYVAVAAWLSGIPPTQPGGEVGPIDYDSDMDRHYIPIHPDWEVQTKGKGSSFRIANAKTNERWLVMDKNLHSMLEQMARDVHANVARLIAERDELRHQCKVANQEHFDLEQERDAATQKHERLEAEFLRSREAAGQIIVGRDATIAELRAEVARLTAENERLSTLADRWNAEGDELREDNKRLAAEAESATLRAENEMIAKNDAQAVVRRLTAELAKAVALATCGCGDGFTEHDPGTCGACLAGMDKTAELAKAELHRDTYRDAWQTVAAEIAELRAQKPVGAQCRFAGEEKWESCALAHHDLVQSRPMNWPDYETRQLYARPVPAAQAPAVAIAASKALSAWRGTGKNMMLAEIMQNGDSLASALRAMLAAAPQPPVSMQKAAS